jgi:hypothetical protein
MRQFGLGWNAPRTSTCIGKIRPHFSPTPLPRHYSLINFEGKILIENDKGKLQYNVKMIHYISKQVQNGGRQIKCIRSKTLYTIERGK